ncbi:hypothetical protein AB833_00210 [Chromatiales bacterium (ex Bugula neritina AB1)]|nr:hypothetical protein AB833_00210 [Chromatiales bacterium (ex Bugula neritina AB1)]
MVRTIDGDDNKTFISYDIRDRKTRQDDPDMGVWTYQFNSFGEMEWQQDAKGQISQTEYDRLGRVTKTWDSSGTEVSTWKTTGPGLGSLEKVMYRETGASFDHYEKSLAYDSLGRVDGSTECLRELNSACENFETDFQYDDQSRLKKTIMHGGVSIERSYQNNQLQKLTRGDGKVLWSARSVNALGQLETEQQGNGIVTRYGYDRTLLASIKAEKLSNIITDQTYTYYSTNAQLHVRTDNIFGMEESFGYDEHLRVSTLTKKYRGISDELIYGYDSLGNINSKPDVLETAGKAYVYGKGIKVDGAGPHAIKSLGGQTFNYDANGNLVSDGTRYVSWTAFNKPSEITAQSSSGNEHLTRFQYGAGGARLKRVETSFDPAFEIYENLSTTTYLDGGGAAQIERVEKDGVTKLKYQYQLGSRVIAIDTVEEDKPTQTNYLHHDHLGSAIAMTDSVGGLLERYSFDVWGKPRTLQSTTESLIDSINVSPVHTKGFTGHEMLSEVGLVHMNGRIYDPALGRFLSADPHIQYAYNTQSFNRYSYVLNNPVGATDPTGYFTKWIRKMAHKSWWGDFVNGFSVLASAAAFVGTFVVTGGNIQAAAGVAGFVSGFSSSYLSGDGLNKALVNGAINGIIAYAAATATTRIFGVKSPGAKAAGLGASQSNRGGEQIEGDTGFKGVPVEINEISENVVTHVIDQVPSGSSEEIGSEDTVGSASYKRLFETELSEVSGVVAESPQVEESKSKGQWVFVGFVPRGSTEATLSFVAGGSIKLKYESSVPSMHLDGAYHDIHYRPLLSDGSVDPNAWVNIQSGAVGKIKDVTRNVHTSPNEKLLWTLTVKPSSYNCDNCPPGGIGIYDLQ